MLFPLLIAAALVATPDAVPPPPSDTITLSPADREAALREGEARAARELPLNGTPSGIHGEMGVAIGSHGGRAAWGAAEVPLGSTGRADFSVSQERFGGFPR